MQRIQLTHPDGKKAPTMELDKYEALKTSLLACLERMKQGSFDELVEAVEDDLYERQMKVKGKLGWNLFWVMLDLEANNLLAKDRSVSPIVYRLPKGK